MVNCSYYGSFLQSNKHEKSDKQEANDNVKVVVRCRPLNQKEKMMGHKQAVMVDEIRGTITVNKLETPQEPPKTFTFDTVFGPDSKQLDVYNLTARPIIDSVLEGYNGTFSVIVCIHKLMLQNLHYQCNDCVSDWRHYYNTDIQISILLHLLKLIINLVLVLN